MRFRLPKGVRKFLRHEKARIRREVFDVKEGKERIRELVNELSRRYNKAKEH